MHPVKSIEARTQSYVLNHFEKSKYAKRLRMLKDTHLGEMCFIIGNGPSLSADDLEVCIRIMFCPLVLTEYS